MAELPTPEGVARGILAVCREINLRPGDALPAKRIQAVQLEAGWKRSELAEGLEFGVEAGWFEKSTDNAGAYLLTEAGFKEM